MQTVDYTKLNLDQNERVDYDFQRRRHDQWKENYELYRDFVIVNRLTQRQSVNIPLMKSTIKTILANTDEFIDLEFEELGNKKDKEIFFNEYWQDLKVKDKLEIKDIVDKKQEYLYGRSWRKLNVAYGKFESEILEPYDILVDRYADPTDLESANHLIHMNIFRTIGQLEANPNYDRDAINRLKVFYATKAGLIKAEQTTQQQYRKNERMQDMGVPDVNNPQVTETLIELKAHYVKVYDDVDEQDHIHVIIKGGSEILMGKPLMKILGVDFYPFVTWADDPERNDFYSDGIADIARTPNKVLNIWFSQMIENRTLRNFGMNYYDMTAGENFIPQTYDAQPWGWYGVPGNPKEIVSHVDIPDLEDTMEQMDYIKNMVQTATAATSTPQGETEKGKITLGEVQLVTQAAMERITSISKFYRLAQMEFGDKLQKIVNANADKLDAVKLYKKGHRGNIFSKTLKPSDWRSEKGYSCTTVSTTERQQKNIDTVQKLNAVASQFPGNQPLIKIYDKKLLEFADLNPDEIKQVMDYQEQLLQQQATQPQLPPAPGNPLNPQGQPRFPTPQTQPQPNAPVAQQAA